MFYTAFTLEIWHGIRHHLIKKEDEVLVSYFCKQKLSRTRLPGWENGKATDREKRTWAFVSIQFPSLPLDGCSFVAEPALSLTFPHVQGEEHPLFKTLQGLINGRNWTWACLRRKPVFKPLLLDSLCWYLGSLLNLLLLNSGFGLVLYLKGQQGNRLSSLWSPWCQRKSKQIVCNIGMCPHNNWGCILKIYCPGRTPAVLGMYHSKSKPLTPLYFHNYTYVIKK